MNKKAIFLTALIIGIMFSIQSVSAACGIWRHHSDVVKVKVNSSLNGENAPIIAIGWSRDHRDDMTFYVTLQGAEWDYGSSGTIQRGVTFSKLDKHTLELSVNVGTGSDEINFSGGANIYLPINCVIKDAGEIRVLVDGTGTTVSNANVLIAQAINGRITVHGNKAKLNKAGSLKKITITDTSTQKYPQNKKFNLELDSGFHFDGGVSMTCTGKFEDAVKFEVDKGNPSKAYITITKETAASQGEIILNDLTVSRNSSSKFNVLLLKTQFDASMVPLKSNLPVASYNAEADAKEAVTETATKTAAEAVTETTTETAATEKEETKPQEETTVIVIPIGSSSYTINGKIHTIDTPAYISSGSTMLPLRALANAMGIEDGSIKYNNETKTATLYKTRESYVSITAGEPTIILAGGGLSANMDISSPAEITNGRLFLPLRAMANALGIPDSNIQYSPSDKTVTITK